MNKKFLFVLLLVFLGTYKAEVKATNERGFVTELSSSGEITPPSFKVPLRNIAVREGEYVMMQATVAGNPLPIIEVFKGNKKIIPSDEIQVETLLNIVTITIKSAHKEDAGEYVIVLTNAAGTVRASCYLTVTD